VVTAQLTGHFFLYFFFIYFFPGLDSMERCCCVEYVTVRDRLLEWMIDNARMQKAVRVLIHL